MSNVFMLLVFVYICFSTIRIVIDGQGEGVNYIEGKMWKFRCKRVLWKLLIRRG